MLAGPEWTVDAEGYVKCPDCGEKKKPGIAGIGNIQKNHVGSQICKSKAAKQSKEGKKLKNTSLLGFFSCGTSKHIMSSVTSNPVSQISVEPNQVIPETLNPEREHEKSTVGTELDVHVKSSLVRKLRQISDIISLDVPEATEENALAQLADPAALDDHKIASEDL